MSKKKDVELTREERAKKQKRKRILLIVGGVLLFFFIVIVVAVIIIVKNISNSFASGAEVEKMEARDIQSSFTIGGTIQSDNTVNLTTPSAILVADAIPVGTFVKKGDPILVFDRTSFDEAYTVADVQDTISMNTYLSSMEKMDDALTKLNAAQADVNKYTKLVNEQQAIVDNLKAGMTDTDQRIAQLQSKIAIARAELDEYTLYAKAGDTYGMSAEGMGTYESYAEAKTLEIAQASRELAALQSGMTNVNQTTALSDATTKLTEYKSELAKAKGEVETYGATAGNEYDRENVLLNGQLTQISIGKGTEILDNYPDGIVRAPYDGVLIALATTKGNYTTPNAAFATFASLDDVSLLVNLTKKDLDSLDIGDKASIKILDKTYDGVVSQVNRMATTTANGTTSIGAIVDIKTPDDDIYIGLEGKATITTADEAGVNSIPIEALNSDNDGDYVYVVDNMMTVSKKYIETGISSADYIEVKSGLDESDWVVTSYTIEPMEGETLVVSTPEYLEQIGK